MASSRRPSGGEIEPGVRITRTSRGRRLLPPLLVFAVAALIAWMIAPAPSADPSSSHEPPPTAPDEPAPTTARRPDALEETPPMSKERAAEIAAEIQQRRAERAIARRDKKEPKYTLNPPGEHGGLEAFPPPGTKPILRGLVVPDDFQLPDGYVRHYQTTDDGRRLPPILMFHPDVAGVDENGNPLTAPGDRVVPPDLVPPGFPIRTLDPDADAQNAPVEGRLPRPDAPHSGMQR